MNDSSFGQLKIALCAVGLLVFGVGPALAGYVSEVTSQNPLFYWRMNDTAADLGANSNKLAVQVDNSITHDSNATADPAQMTAGDTTGNALTPAGGFGGFEASNAWISLTQGTLVAGSSISTLTTPLGIMDASAGSVAVWVRVGAAGLNAGTTNINVVSRFDSGSNRAVELIFDDTGHVRFANGNLDTCVTSNTYHDNQWHHVVATWTRDAAGAGTLSLYLDGGTLAGGETVVQNYTGWVISATPFTGRNQFAKGTNNASEFEGSIDEGAIWNTVLTAQQVAAQYQSAIPEPGVLVMLGLAVPFVLRRRVA